MSTDVDIPEGFDPNQIYRPREIVRFFPYTVKHLSNLRNRCPKCRPRPKCFRLGVRQVAYKGSDFIEFVKRDLREL